MPSPEELAAYEEWLRRTGGGTTLPDTGSSTVAAEVPPPASAATPLTVADYDEWESRQHNASIAPQPTVTRVPDPFDLRSFTPERADQPTEPSPRGQELGAADFPNLNIPREPLTTGQKLGRLGRAVLGASDILSSPFNAGTQAVRQFAAPALATSPLSFLSPTPPRVPLRPEAGLFERLVETERQEPLVSQLIGGALTDPTLLIGPGAVRLGGRAAAGATAAAREAVPLARPVGKALAASSREVDAASARFELLSGQFEQASQRLDEAKAELEATLARGRPAPKFGTRERAEFDVERRGKVSKAEQVRRARVNLRTVREETAGIQRDMEEANAELDRVLMEPVTEPIAPESRLVPPSTEPTPTAGAVQAGMGIGERPAQGTLGLGGQIEARPPVPLIDAEQVAEQQRLAAERAAGQRALPEAGQAEVDRLMALRQTPPPPPPAARVPLAAGQSPPPGSIVGTATSDLPPSGPVTPSDMQRIIRQAEETVRQDRPGVVSDILQKVPGLKQARAFERPGLAMTGENENVLIAHVAENLAKEDVRAQVTASRVPIDRELAAAFGPKVVAGDESPIKFLGTPEQAKSPLIGTLVDIAERPQLYELTTAQKQALVNLEDRNIGLLQSTNQGYNTKIGQYPAEPGGAFLTHVDVPEDFPGNPFNRETLNVSRGGSKPRIYQTNAERLEADPTYKPELNVTKLLDSMDNAKIRAAAGETFREAVGGLTKLDVMQETHPNLYNKMTALQTRLQTVSDAATRLGGKQKEVIDTFLSSPLENVDLATLQADLNPSIGANAVGRQGPNFGKDLKTLRTEIAAAKKDIANLRPYWNSADLKPYQIVQQGIYRYFPPEQASLIQDLRKQSNSPVLKVIESIRAGAFSADLSPFLGVQTPLGVLANPIGSSKMAAGAIVKAVEDRNLLRSFSSRALAEDMASDPSWREYASFIGRAPTATPAEFSAGYLSRIPGVGPLISKFTEGSYVVVTRQSKGLWQSMTDSLMKSGVPEVEAKVAAAGVSSEVFPMMSPTRLGQSPARNAMIRALPTSYSFIRQPASLIAEATRGYVKLGLKQTLTPKERLAVQVGTTMAASVMSASVASAVLSAEATGGDAAQAALDAVNPDPKNGRFASLVFGKNRVPLGGPYRGLFRAIYPREVEGIPVPIPFAGIAQFAQNRINPAIATQLRLYKNKDFYGKTIRQGTFQEQLLQSLYYEMQGVAPLTIGTAIEGVRGIASGEEIATQTIGQFAGSNVSPTETVRETAAKYEKENRLPPDDTSLTILRTAYWQAGEGLLSEEGRTAWKKYEPLPEKERHIMERTLTPEVRAEVHRVEDYRERRRIQLARAFPELDVLIVEEQYQKHKDYNPKTTAGKTRQRELRATIGE